MSESEEYSSENSDSQSSGEEFLPDLNKLKPYDLEPMISGDSEEHFDDNTSDDSDEEEQRRIGNINWCQCGRCQPMFTYTESLCCQETNEVPEELFEGFEIINFHCILFFLGFIYFSLLFFTNYF